MKAIISIGATLLISTVLQAQMPGPPHRPGGPFGLEARDGFGLGRSLGKVVAGAPYSADVSNAVTETLSDGNTIQHTSTGHVARDSQGRTYLQQTVTGGPFGQNGPATFTFISDPVAGYVYVLNAQNKTATRRPFRTANRANSGQAPARPPRPSSADVVQTDLGTQVVNGVNAQGKKIVRTIAAGAIGNAQPIVSTSEVWYSPDLQVVISSTRSDPRMGQATYTLSNIQRAEPSASLFQVPSDYTVKDARAHPGPRGGGPGEPPVF